MSDYCTHCGADLTIVSHAPDCAELPDQDAIEERDRGNEPPANSDQEPDDYPWDDQRDDRVKQGMGEPNYSEAEPAGLDDPMSWER